jgi:hypothetical protein
VLALRLPHRGADGPLDLARCALGEPDRLRGGDLAGHESSVAEPVPARELRDLAHALGVRRRHELARVGAEAALRLTMDCISRLQKRFWNAARYTAPHRIDIPVVECRPPWISA